MKDGSGIAKNSLILYGRMLVLLFLSLYTSRIVLSALGAVDYGLYNVVGGVVITIGFLTGTLNTASARYITVALGKGDEKEIRTTFSNILAVNIMLALAVIVISETIGLWFLCEKMTIPEERVTAAIWVYQLSIVTVAINIISIPYNACIIAHERMKAFAYITIVDGVGKLVVAFLLIYSASVDRLVLYAVLIFLIQITDRCIYGIYCSKNFKETRGKLVLDKKMLRGMAGFISWAAYGSLVSVGFTQGLNILLNLFFGPAVNAARAVSVQVQNVAQMFTTNFQTAINPRIIKSVAVSDFQETRDLLQVSSKMSFSLLSVISVPLVFAAPFLLNLWLGKAPEHTVAFVRLMLVTSIMSSIANPLRIINQAEGNIKKFQICECSVLLTIVPLSYIALKVSPIPELVFCIHLVIEIIAHFVRVRIVVPKIKMRVADYFKAIYVPLVGVLVVALASGYVIFLCVGKGIAGQCLTGISAELVLIAMICMVGLNKRERMAAKGLLQKALDKMKGKKR